MTRRIDKAYTYWDELQIVDDHLPDWRLEHPEYETEEEAREALEKSPSFWEMVWEDVVSDVHELIWELNPEGRPWVVDGSGMGWQKHSGSATLSFDTGEELVRKFFTNFQCNWYVFKDNETSFHIVRTSHDELGAVFEFSVAEEKDCPRCGEHYYEHEDHETIEKHGVCWRCLEYNPPVCPTCKERGQRHPAIYKWWQCKTCDEWYCDEHPCVTALGLNVECYTCQDKRLEEEAG